ncbi:receptor-like serine/threonine-protein kinase ALE2 isoform X2 [Impatiens glandulifera]|uniref:receptor-like serine/threonine-protein kinase ALE2 isoform X2 n=1 Tax=Impatiens glandulifera TaxID=253017 RepID=UPI001FB0E64E|nr:receptor-like serine/threonine-protein kinase ALE2 isoform X2 [Impatiens glandulifera]
MAIPLISSNIIAIFLVLCSLFIYGSAEFDIFSLKAVIRASIPDLQHNEITELSPSPSPLSSFFKRHHLRKRIISLSPEPSNQPSSHNGRRHRGHLISPSQSPAPSISETTSSQFNAPTLPPSSSSLGRKIAPQPMPFMALPPPPPNHDCTSVTCTDPLTYTLPGSSCGCVWPIQVRLLFNIELYTFFPLVSELAKEIATSLELNQSQVRIMGANAASQQLDKANVLINLIPLRLSFNHSVALLVFDKFWLKQVPIRTSLFGTYDVVYVHYPGLPLSPPSANAATIDGQPLPNSGKGGSAIKPIGVDIPRKQKDGSVRISVILIILSCVTFFVVCLGTAWFLLVKCGCVFQPAIPSKVPIIPSQENPSGTAGPLAVGSKASSASMSFGSNLLAYTGTAKVFGLDEIERATDIFDESRILGEGGFGLVYKGILDDGRDVAVKVLKREDQRGSREFLAEVEMLSRLHHRNLVKLMGICSEEHTRCLVYELIPNGSVESHLHGIDKENSPLNWAGRMKIALGAARGLAYLHEDSSPRVIHRDFKSSNILLEHDFTPKVSDFGLARTASEEGGKHISTHVMGTFGYLAPEYAMTGHLLVKSDVYSYGVVLLELLTGRKPVDLSQPPGQENLVSWARPLLTTNDGLESLLDQSLKLDVPYDIVAKVAAIASMCVQPEVSHRPFMGEVVQALKLVCNEFDETRDTAISRSSSREDLFVEGEDKNIDYDHDLEGGSGMVGGYDYDGKKMALSSTDLIGASAGFEEQERGSFRRHYNSAPLRMERKRRPFWQRLGGFSGGSMSERGFTLKFWPGNNNK